MHRKLIFPYQCTMRKYHRSHAPGATERSAYKPKYNLMTNQETVSRGTYIYFSTIYYPESMLHLQAPGWIIRVDDSITWTGVTRRWETKQTDHHTATCAYWDTGALKRDRDCITKSNRVTQKSQMQLSGRGE